MSISLPTKNLSSISGQLFSRPCFDAWSQKVFSFSIVFIVCVSIYDSYLVAAYSDCILMNERNPICEYLIRQDPGQLSWFMSGKLLGNLAVVSTLLGLFFYGYRHTVTVAKSVACFQLMLLVYLTFSDPKSGLLHFDGFGSIHRAEFLRAIKLAAIHLSVLLPTIVGGVFVKRNWKSVRGVWETARAGRND